MKVTLHVTRTDVDRYLGQRLQAARLACGLTLKDAAARLDCHVTILRRMELGERSIDPRHLILSSVIFQISLPGLFKDVAGMLESEVNVLNCAGKQGGMLHPD